MTRCADPHRLAAGVAVLALIGVPLGLCPALAASADVELASHRAIYDLKLADARGRRQLTAAQGRIVYDFSGSSCEGYALQFRQVTELDNGEGKVVVSDLRSATWEEGAAKNYRFNFQNYLSERLVDSVDGRAVRGAQAIGVNLVQPSNKHFDLDQTVVFPTEHIRRILVAARAGQTVLELPVYDGSETGEKLYNTLTVIGQPIAPDARKPDDAAAGQAALDGMKRWPVTVSYFDKSKQGGEQTPVYSIRFELYENGVSRALLLDYGDFAISGTMSSLEMRESPPCR
ncbi:MAG: cell envelope integrity EipB family protein [Xanthobacteraceae bacterium]